LLLQPAKVESLSATATKVTGVFRVKLALQAGPLPLWQLIPAGVLVTVPPPLPAGLTVSMAVVTFAVKVAVTVVSTVGATTQGPVPLHPPPDQPVKLDPAAAVAVKLTDTPFGTPSEHWVLPLPQLITGGVLVTVPLPFTATVRVAGPIKLPNAIGEPTPLIEVTALVAVAITEMVLDCAFAT